MMLEYLAFEEAAIKLKSSLSQIYAEGNLLTKDQGGSATTTQFCDAIKGLIEWLPFSRAILFFPVSYFNNVNIFVTTIKERQVRV